MKLIIWIIISFSLLMDSFLDGNNCKKFYRQSHVKKRLGYNYIQDIIEICKSDSFFNQTVHYQRKASKSIEIIKTETFVGKWHVNQDTLIIMYFSETYGDSIFHKYYIDKRKLVYLKYGESKVGGIVKSNYKWRLKPEESKF